LWLVVFGAKRLGTHRIQRADMLMRPLFFNRLTGEVRTLEAMRTQACFIVMA
jgi:hypothetical protein